MSTSQEVINYNGDAESPLEQPKEEEEEEQQEVVPLEEEEQKAPEQESET